VSALREAANDPGITRVLYDTMSLHARDSLAQYIGKRVITALLALVLSTALAWGIFTGHVK
jgi:hypothetical protein